MIWNTHKFQTGTDWTSGDFNGDGITDGTDFVIWNEHKFTSADRTQFVPEPQAWMLLLLATFGARTFLRRAARNLQLATGRP